MAILSLNNSSIGLKRWIKENIYAYQRPGENIVEVLNQYNHNFESTGNFVFNNSETIDLKNGYFSVEYKSKKGEDGRVGVRTFVKAEHFPRYKNQIIQIYTSKGMEFHIS